MGLFEDSHHPLRIREFEIYKTYLSRAQQEQMVEEIREIARRAPLFQPVLPSGRKMSVKMTSAGLLGWVADRKGYRYEGKHPSGVNWPPIPDLILAVWQDLVPSGREPDCCLINHYGPDAKMGMHQDNDEGDFTWPVLSISLGDDGLFRMGHVTRGGSTQSHWLQSGDIVLMGGPARLAYHGVDRIKPGTSALLNTPGRINVTLRVVSSA